MEPDNFKRLDMVLADVLIELGMKEVGAAIEGARHRVEAGGGVPAFRAGRRRPKLVLICRDGRRVA